MKNFLIICGIAVFTFCSCDSGSSEPDSSELEANFEQGPELTDLVKSTVLLDGEEITIYTDEDKGELFSMKDGELVNVEKLSENGNLGFYVSSDFEGFALFSSREKLDVLLENEKKLTDLNQKMNILNPTKRDTAELEKGSSSLASCCPGNGSFIIASAHSLGGFRHERIFNLFGSPTVYSNPHLRCNQYETGCYNFNDRISSIRVQYATAEFYTGSFVNFGSWLYVNSLNGVRYIANLNDIGWNDKITAFWADDNFRASRNISGLNTQLANCGHNYNDPACP